MKVRPPLSETELAILKVLWDHGAGTVREVQAIAHRKGRAWAYTTVQTLLARLQRKGYVSCLKSPPAHIYQPVLSRDEILQSRLTDLAEELCGGVASPLVLALVEGKRFSAAEIEQFRKALDEMEATKSAKKRR